MINKLKVTNEIYNYLIEKDKRLEAVLIKDYEIEINDDYFESLISSIIYQQLSYKAANSIYKKFKILVKNVEPQSILKNDIDTLRLAGLSRAKALYVIEIAKAFINDSSLYKIDLLEDDEVIKRLTKIKGIGIWTAQMFLIFTLGRMNILPIGDLGIKKGVLKILNKDELLKEDIEECFTLWSPYNTIVSLCLWKGTD
jgi:3-methyladenine DNA glycosylase/8-oxoguanine DNA glycosylase